MAKRKSIYFDAFISHTEIACEAAAYLKSALSDFKPKTLHAQRVHMHEIENRADEAKHAAMNKLAKEFVTPIDREDIIQLLSEADDVVDLIDDVLARIYMYNIKEIMPQALHFTDVIVRSCEALLVATKEFPNFQKSSTLQQAIIDVNTLEEEGDAIYIDALRTLYKDASDPVKVIAWSQTFDCLEQCCDACEHVADIMESIVMKNS